MPSCGDPQRLAQLAKSAIRLHCLENHGTSKTLDSMYDMNVVQWRNSIRMYGMQFVQWQHSICNCVHLIVNGCVIEGEILGIPTMPDAVHLIPFQHLIDMSLLQIMSFQTNVNDCWEIQIFGRQYKLDDMIDFVEKAKMSTWYWFEFREHFYKHGMISGLSIWYFYSALVPIVVDFDTGLHKFLSNRMFYRRFKWFLMNGIRCWHSPVSDNGNKVYTIFCSPLYESFRIVRCCPTPTDHFWKFSYFKYFIKYNFNGIYCIMICFRYSTLLHPCS